MAPGVSQDDDVEDDDVIDVDDVVNDIGDVGDVDDDVDDVDDDDDVDGDDDVDVDDDVDAIDTRWFQDRPKMVTRCFKITSCTNIGPPRTSQDLKKHILARVSMCPRHHQVQMFSEEVA